MIEVCIQKQLGEFRLEVAFAGKGIPLGILGASGCGKSLTLRCIAGIETPDAGRIVVNGRVLFDRDKGINLPPQQRRVGYLFQSYALFPNMTVRENIGCGIPSAKGDKTQAVDRLIQQFGLEGLEPLYPRQLSGGQQQRVALARMLAAQPEVLLLDEPFSALDAHLREQLQLYLTTALQSYPDTILVTHNRNEVYRLCGDLAVMADGRCILVGDTKEVFEAPRYIQAAMLTGCKNLSPARQCGENRLLVPGWNLTLETSHPIPPDVTHVGIYPHQFQPVVSPEQLGGNCIPIGVWERWESPASYELRFAPEQAACPSEDLCWSIGKEQGDTMPQWLFIPPRAVLPLIGNPAC